MRRTARWLLLPALAVLPAPVRAQAAEPAAVPVWRIDVTHSELFFRIRHLVSRVPGTFREWRGSITADPANFAAGSVEVVIQTASIDTRNERRDADLRSANFFEIEKYPTITFRSTRVEVDGNAIRLHGDLTIRDVTRSVVLDTDYDGQVDDPWGNRRAAFTATAQISRKDFNVRWNQMIEAGGAVVGDNVKITLHLEVIRQA